MSIFKKQKKVGMLGRVRLRREVEGEYQKEALKVGHKSRMILEHQKQIDTLQREVEEGLSLMQKLDGEFKSAAPDSKPEAEKIAPQDQPQPAPEVSQ